MNKSFVLNIENLNTDADATTIYDHFMNIHGVERVKIELDLKLVSLYYSDEVGSPHKLLTAFETIGYHVR